MKKPIFTLIVLSLSLFVLACNASDLAPSESPRPKPRPERVQSFAKTLNKNFKKHQRRWQQVSELSSISCSDSQNSADVLSCTIQSCERAGGHYNRHAFFCQCPTGLTFNGRSQVCLPPTPDASVANSQEFRIQTEEFKGESFAETLDSAVQGMGLQVSKKQMQSLSFNLPAVHLHKKATVMRPHLIWKQATKLTTEDLRLNLFVNRLGYSVTPIVEANYGAESIEGLIWFDPARAGMLPLASNDSTFADDLFNASLEADWKISQSASEEGSCNDVCHIDHTTEISFMGGKFFVQRRVVLVEGIYKHAKVYISSTPNYKDSEWVVVLDRYQRPNLVYDLWTDQTDIFLQEKTFKAYSKNGDLLKEGSLFETAAEQEHARIFNSRAIDFAKADESTVLICEGHFLPQKALNPKFAGRLAVGPHRASLKNGKPVGSVWGWLKNDEGSSYQFWMGSRPWGDVGLLDSSKYKMEVEDESHLIDVIGAVFTASDSASVTVSSAAACLQSKQSGLNIATKDEFPGRVVNMSVAVRSSAKQCSQQLKNISSVKDKLWVQASGNDNMKFACHDRIKLLENVISVAEVSPDRPNQLVRGSIRGRHKVSTAAERVTESTGSSFSAPVVAAAASDILQKYPSIPVADLKLSLMLGVRFLKLEVASGGVTTKELSMKVADALADGATEVEELLLNVYPFDKLENDLEKVDAEMELDWCYLSRNTEECLTLNEYRSLNFRRIEIAEAIEDQFDIYEAHINWANKYQGDL